jgi:Uma2 family endonuclease
MGEAGILSEDDRVELIRGELLAMSPIGPRHNAAVDRANRSMVRTVGDGAIVRVQGSVRLDEYDEPQPDIAVLAPSDDFYASGMPGPADIWLILEVAESSIGYDRGVKARLYAEAGIVEYWLLDLKNDCLYAYSDPHNGTYRVVRQFCRGDSIALERLPAYRFRIDDLLP